VEDRLPARGAQERELEPLRHEGEPEVEVEDVRLRQQARQRLRLDELAPQQWAVRPPVQVPVRLGVRGVDLEDDEPRVDALPPQRLHVRPSHPGEIHRTVRYAEGSSHSTWSK
jgi:hypothetical protein